MVAVTVCSDFGALENKVSRCFHCFPIYLLWSDGTRCHGLFPECWVVSQLFHSPLSLSSRCSLVLLSAIRVVSSAYLRLLIFLPAILIPACVSFSLVAWCTLHISLNRVTIYSLDILLLKPSLENFEHYFATVWDECNCAVVWTFFGIAFLWDWNENSFFSPVTTAEFSKFTGILSAAVSQQHFLGFEISTLDYKCFYSSSQFVESNNESPKAKP